MSNDEFFRLNGIDVGFSAQTDVSIRCGRIRLKLHTPPMRLTRDLHNGMYDHARKPIDDCYMADGFSIAAYESIALPGGRYGQTVRFPHVDARKNRHTLHLYDGQACPNFFGTVRIEQGWLHLDGVASYEDAPPRPAHRDAMPINICKRFEPRPLIPPRQKLTLQAARTLKPEDVYCLHIDPQNAVKTFPMEILAFRNLEDLWLTCHREQAPNPLPEALFNLTELHSLNLQWSALDIGALPEQINRLNKLETLCLIACNITLLPESLAALSRLETLDVSYNKLETLPDCLGSTSSLRNLDARGNSFTSLPKNLVNIPSVRVSYPDQALYRDPGYATNHVVPVDDAQFALSAKPELFASVSQLLDARSDDEDIKRCMLAESTCCVYASGCSIGIDALIRLGASKTGGAPHLPKHVAHPCNVNGLFPTFYAQLNLAEIAPLQTWLPRRGMLYFFIGDFRYAENPVVIYADVDADDLAVVEYTAKTRWINSDVDAFDDGASPSLAAELRLQFSAGVSMPYLYRATARRFPALGPLFTSESRADRKRIEDFDRALDAAREALSGLGLMPSEHAHSLNGWVWSDDETSTEQASLAKGGYAHEWINLLVLESVGDFCFGDAGSIAFCIHKKDLAATDFSQVVCYANS